MKIVKAIVIDNNDTDKTSKIQVRLIPYMNDVKDSDLPWISPYTNSKDSQTDIGKHEIPEVDSYVRVIVESMVRQEFKYMSGYYFEGANIFSKWSSIESEISEVSDWSYPQPTILETFSDGSAIFRNTETGAYCNYHSSGTYALFDDDGNIVTYSKDKGVKSYNDKGSIEITDTGDITLSNEKNTLEMLNAGDTTLSTTSNTITVTDTGDVTVENSATGNIKLNNATCDVSIGTASVTVNGNLEVLV